MRSEVVAEPRAWHRRGAELFAEAFDAAVEARGRFAVALAGGNSPKGVYDLLGRPYYAERLPWDKAHVFFGDERCVPPGHADSNYRMAKEAFLDRLPIPAGRVRRIRGEDGPREAARAYAEELRAFFGSEPVFDLVLLGLGPDGHTASLFPGDPALESDAWTAPVERPDHPRVTLTYPVLNRARSVVFLAAGEAKAAAVRAARKGLVPAGRVRPPAAPLWLLDDAAAAGLGGA